MPKTKNAFALRDFQESISRIRRLYPDVEWLVSNLENPNPTSKREELFDAVRKCINAEACGSLMVLDTEFEFEMLAVDRDLVKLRIKLKRVDAHISQLRKYLDRIVDRLISGDDNDARERAARAKHYLSNYNDMYQLIVLYGAYLGKLRQYYRDRLPAEFKKDFGGRLKQARQRKGLTVDKVAEMLNLSYNGYSQYERGIREPSLLTLRQLAKILDVSADWLLGIKK